MTYSLTPEDRRPKNWYVPDQAGQTDSKTDRSVCPYVQEYVARGGQIKKVPKGKKVLSGSQIDLLVRREYAQLAVQEKARAEIEADRAGRRSQRGKPR